jgi:hypothetical protein
VRKMDAYLAAALQLHQHLVNRHWNGKALVGPDPIGKVHWRVTRFVRSYLPWLPGDDHYIYLQGQAYWIMANIALHRLTQEPQYLEFAFRSADYIVAGQPADGAWRHPPIRGRQGLIATVEGVWASLGLLSAYREFGQDAYLDAARRWYQVQVQQIGFEEVDGGLAANYYAGFRSKIPNVTTMFIWLAEELYDVTNDERFVERTPQMLRFIENSQLDSGELPYALDSRTHFMCYQYNAFQFCDLAHYYELAEHAQVYSILMKMAEFLSTGVTGNGSSRYNCFKATPEVHYWTSALAAALRRATELGLADYTELSERAFEHLLAKQRQDGSFDFSLHNYGFLRDSRSYPRYLAMILMHLLNRVDSDDL